MNVKDVEVINLYHFVPAHKNPYNEHVNTLFHVTEVKVEAKVPWWAKQADEIMLCIDENDWKIVPSEYTYELPGKESGLERFIKSECLDADIYVDSNGFYYISVDDNADSVFMEKIREYESKKLEDLKAKIIKQANRFDFIMSETQGFIEPTTK